MSSLTAAQAAQWLRERDGFLILTHRRPDGDTLGCAAALCRTLQALGKTAWLLPNEDTTELFTPYLVGTLAPTDFTPAHIVSVDISSEHLFPASAAAYQGRVELAIDHHISNEGFARYNCVETDKAACGEIMYTISVELLGTEKNRLPTEIALPLYLAVSTDTGCFVYTNTTAHTHKVAAALIETGIDFRAVNKRQFRTKTRKRLQIEARMLETMELYDDGQTAFSFITLSDLAEFQAGNADLEDIAAFTGQLDGVRTAITFRETQPDDWKISVRTQAGLPANQICAALGGGGHAAAAGCTAQGTRQEVKQKMLDAIQSVQSVREGT